MVMLLVWLAAFARAEVEQLIRFEIPEDAAVRSFRLAAQQAGVDILVVPSVVGAERTHAVRGSFTLRQAFDQMVAGTSLDVVRDATSGAYAVIRRTGDREPTVAATTPTPRQDETSMNARKTPSKSPAWALISLLAFGAGAGAQEQATAGSADADTDEEIITLTPFVVDAQKDTGYRATETLAGTRIRTDLSDVGSSISVLTAEFLRDVGGTNNETTLAYALNTEVGGARGNFSGGVQVSSQNTNELALFANPNGNTRVRGLTNADNTRNFFLNDIPWDGYTVSRVDLQRGPNAMLFGLGSPAGVVNASINNAEFRNRGELGFTFDQFGSTRTTIDVNRQILKDELAVRGAVLLNRQKFRQDPAYSDDTRYFGAVSYSPKLLNQEDMRFNISGNFEKGSIDSNRPRILAPLDQISAWWLPNSEGGLNKATYNPTQVKNLTDTQSPDYLSPLGGFRSQGLVYDPLAGTLGFRSPSNFKARRPDGSIIWTSGDSAAGPFPQSNFYSLLGQRNQSEWASSEGLPFSDFGGYDPATMTDSTIFDFYNKLIDGPNKGEWTDWEVFDLSLTQTFFNEKIGYNLAAFQQDLDRGQWAAIGWQNRVMIDINTHNLDGTPNPNVGRAFIEEELRDTNNTGTSDRDAYRAQLFLKHNFAEGDKGFLTRLLGEHRLTGSLSQENQKTDSRGIKGHNFDTATLAKFTSNPYIEGGEGSPSNAFRYYLSDDLRGASSSRGLNLSRITVPFMRTPGGMTQVRYFDTTWTAAPSVDPGAFWQSPDPYDDDLTSSRLTQSANPANYRGWTTTEANLITFFSDQTVNGMSSRDYLTSNARLSEFNVDSLTLVWQGYLWDKSIVGTYGYRKDEARSYQYESGYRAGNYRPDTRGADLDPVRYNFSNPEGSVRELETTTKNWSVAAHVNRLLGGADFLPVNLSLYYNKGENFQPLAGRIDVNANPLPPPQGKTEEYSALISTKDQKYSIRLTNYETEVTNGTSTGSIGNMWALEQVLGALPNSPANLLRDFRAGRVPLSAYSSDTAAQAKLTGQIMPAWFAFEQALLEQFPDYVHEWMGENTTWGTSNNTHVTSAAPAGFSYTENSVSEGWELEFTANPLENWRIMINASKTEASRTEVPGVAFKAVADFIDEQFMTTDAGMAPIWWHGNTFGQRNFGPYPWNFRPDYLKLKALNGQSNPEVRKYRANLVTSYDFNSGKLKGAGIGGAYRWEDDAVIDYAPMKNADGSNGINLDAPVWAKGNDSVDLWLSYRFKIGDKIWWRMQLNVYNVFGENELVPVTASVDPVAIQTLGTITPDSVIPMRPSAYFIREGRSWTFSNTIEF
jgi:outer membrane receptor protein involved in Fe transport